MNAPEELLREVPGIGEAAITELKLVRAAALTLRATPRRRADIEMTRQIVAAAKPLGVRSTTTSSSASRATPASKA